MVALPYTESINEALDRLRGVGFEFGSGFVNHAPMAAEALATVGYDEVADWVEENKRRRHYLDPPEAGTPIDAADRDDWTAALGDFRRVRDWVAMFEGELARSGTEDVLTVWLPRLLSGSWGMLTHGLIRTAHAVRSVDTTPDPTVLQLNELAQGLGYWASRYRPAPEAEPLPIATHADVGSALSELTVTSAGMYAQRTPQAAIPLVHTITAPAALRLLLPHIPDDMCWTAFATLERTVAAIWSKLGAGAPAESRETPTDRPSPTLDHLMAEAIDLGDEHGIKLAEACLREHAVRPDARYPAATATLIHRLKTDPH